MKSFETAFWIAALAAGIFLYQVHAIHGQNKEAAVLIAAYQNNQNPGTGTYVQAFFDGLTFGAFANEGIFTEAKKNERESNQIKAYWANLQSRNADSIWYRNCGFIIGTIALVVGFQLKKKAQ